MVARSRNRGFTAVELVVIVIIVGILIALLIPAVQSVREGGNRANCCNNMQQISLAMMNYQSLHRPAAGFQHALLDENERQQQGLELPGDGTAVHGVWHAVQIVEYQGRRSYGRHSGVYHRPKYIDP